MAKLIINRTNEYSYRLRKYKIYLDGNLIGSINNGQKIEYEINSDEHSICVQLNPIIRSPSIQFICQGNKISFQVGSTKFGRIKLSKQFFIGLFGLELFLIICIVLILRIDYKHSVFVCLIGALIYLLLFGKNSYLSINEID